MVKTNKNGWTQENTHNYTHPYTLKHCCDDYVSFTATRFDNKKLEPSRKCRIPPHILVTEQVSCNRKKSWNCFNWVKNHYIYKGQ